MKRALVLFLVVVFLLLAPAAPSSEPTTLQTLPSLPVPDPSNLLLTPVIRVVDGDTFVVLLDGRKTTVRLIGVDTPETVHPAKPVQPYGKEASTFTSNLLLGEEVWLRVGSPPRDRYGRTLAYAWRSPDGLFVNAEILRQGYGRALTTYPCQFKTEFLHLEALARQSAKGLWAAPPPTSSPHKN